MPGPAAPATPTWSDWTNATYISKLFVDGKYYTIKDSQARENITANKYDIEMLKQTVACGVHFRGITVTEITDGESGKTLYDKDGNPWSQPGLTVDGAQQVGDIFIYNNGTKNLEFIVVAVENESGHTSYKYSEFGSTGTLGALAYANTASGDVTVPLSSNITFNTFTPNVTKGDLGVSTSDVTLSLSSVTTSASVTVGAVSLLVPTLTVGISPTTDTFTALSDVTYDASNEVLTLTSLTSAEFWTEASAKTAQVTITGEGPAVEVSYAKASMDATRVLTGASLTGELSVTGAKPTATITNPTITVTVEPDPTV